MTSVPYLPAALEVVRVCQRCSTPLASVGIARRDAKYCSTTCRVRASQERRRDEINAANRAKTASKPKHQHACEQCKGRFESTWSVVRFCSTRCQAQYGRDNPDGSCATDGCHRTSEARGLCQACYKRARRAEKPWPSDDVVWGERRKANHHKRRALKLKLPADIIRPLDVHERDEWTCGICSEPVDREVSWPDPLSPSLDHILPLSKGGHHVMENVQLAHLNCNVRKGARVESEMSAMLV